MAEKEAQSLAIKSVFYIIRLELDTRTTDGGNDFQANRSNHCNRVINIHSLPLINAACVYGSNLLMFRRSSVESFISHRWPWIPGRDKTETSLRDTTKDGTVYTGADVTEKTCAGRIAFRREVRIMARGDQTETR